MAGDKDLKLETKCYDACEYGYLYGLNRKIPDEEGNLLFSTFSIMHVHHGSNKKKVTVFIKKKSYDLR